MSYTLSDILFGKTRQAVLSLLYGHPEQEYYIRQMARMAGVGMGSLQRELEKLETAGIISRNVKGNQVFFKANRQCPVFDELQSLVVKTVLAGNVLKDALLPLANRIDIAFLYGSTARGEMGAGSDIDIMIIGNVSFAEAVEACFRAQDRLTREVNPTVYPVEEFIAKINDRHHFLTSVLKERKIFIIGDEHELEKLAGQ